MRAREVLERWSAMGAAAQATVPGLYAWGVTVAPSAFGRGTSTVARIAALLALFAISAGLLAERRWGGRGRIGALWVFVLCCALTWSAAPAALGPARMDGVQGLAGMLGWALYGLACAAPALQARRESDRIVVHEPRPAAGRGVRQWDAAVYLAGGVLAAAALQTGGWMVAGVERALLVRLVALAVGLALIGASVDVALARSLHDRIAQSRELRLRRAKRTFVALALLGLAGVLFVVR